MTNNITYAITHSGSTYYHRKGIPTLLGAKRIARQDIAQSFNGQITVHAEDNNYKDEFGNPMIYDVAVLFDHDKKWTDVT